MKKNPSVFHPIIISIIPAISLYVQNAFKLKLVDVLPTIVFILSITLLIWVLIQRMVKNIQKSGLIVSVFSLLFFLYGHVLPAIINLVNIYFKIDLGQEVANQIRGYSIILLGVWFLLFFVICFLTLISRSRFQLITQFLNIFSLVLAGLMFSKALGSFYFYRNLLIENAGFQDYQQELVIKYSGTHLYQSNLPDVYYIILDGHARSDILYEIYQYDNTGFLNELIGLGFYIADQSYANYGMTVLSLASSLNSRYLDHVIEKVGADSINPAPVISMIQENSLMQYLKPLGYASIAFSSGYSATELRDADIFYSPENRLNGYQNELINLTPLRLLLVDFQYDKHRENITLGFHQLSSVAEIDQPTFTFLHILAPHPPFVFDANGDPVNPPGEFSIGDGNHFTDFFGREEYVSSYRDQLSYLDQQVLLMIKEILARSAQPPIIVLQADHGPGSMLNYDRMEDSNIQERMAILNAYYFPDQDYQLLYPGITPVNTFRIILNQYFNSQLELLADKSYFSSIIQPYKFVDVTDLLQRYSESQ